MCGFLSVLSSIMICAAFQWMRKYLVLSVALKIIVSILAAFGGNSLIILSFIRSKPGVLLVLMSVVSLLTSFMVVLGMSLVSMDGLLEATFGVIVVLFISLYWKMLYRCSANVLDFSGAFLAQLPFNDSW